MKLSPGSLISVLLIWLATAPARGAELTINGYVLRVPDDFTVDLVAGKGLVEYPICADFDEQGRLYVAESSGAKDWNSPQTGESRHRVLRLEDTDEDGVFDRRTVFATFEMLSQGSMWLNGSLYVAAPPILWKLTDEDDDGVADRREKWIETDEVTGCLNDVRGPFAGPDGWIYWCKGAGTKQTFPVAGKPWSTTARHIFRRHPDHDDVEQVMVSGMDNPVEVAFSRGGERFVTGTNIHYLGQSRRDGIFHAVYGGVYPKDIAPVYDFPWSGPRMMPELTGWSALSPAGLTSYESGEFGDDYRDNLFSALFSGHRVLRHVLQPAGGTFHARDEDFLVCDDPQFHPTDVLEDADGSLLVIETGGWYLHCCPSSTFYRPDRRGAIYRVRRTGKHELADARGKSLNWDDPGITELADRLADRRTAVRRRAVRQLGNLGQPSATVLRKVIGRSPEVEARLEAVRAATRIDGEIARDAVRRALNDSDEVVCHAALSSISLWRDRKAVPKLLKMLRHSSGQLQRVAAEALGRIGEAGAVPALLDALSKPSDRFLEHSLTFALIEIGDPKRTRDGLFHESLQVRRAAMIALDQIPGGRLDPDLVIAELDSTDGKMQETAWWLVSRHSRDWGGMLADKFREQVRDEQLTDDERRALVSRLADVARAPQLSAWMAAELTKAGASSETQIVLLQAMANARIESAAADSGKHSADIRWIEAMLELIEGSSNPAVVAEAVAALRKQPQIGTRSAAGKRLHQALNEALRQSVNQPGLNDETRLVALSAIRGSSLGRVDDQLFAYLLSKISPDEPFNLRSAAADALSRCQLDQTQLRRLAGSLKNVAATELKPLLSLFQNEKDDAVGERLIASLEGSAATTALNAFRLRTCLANFGPVVQQRAGPIFERLHESQAEQLEKAQRVMQLVPNADPDRGREVFSSNKAACLACHKTAHLGGAIGPNLRGIGPRRTERDLVESILFPSASMVQSFETWVVVTTSGLVASGVITKDLPSEVVLESAPDKSVRIPRDTIVEMSRGDVSIMPQGLDQQFTESELADLVAYLKSL